MPRRLRCCRARVAPGHHPSNRASWAAARSCWGGVLEWGAGARVVLEWWVGCCLVLYLPPSTAHAHGRGFT